MAVITGDTCGATVVVSDDVEEEDSAEEGCAVVSFAVVLQSSLSLSWSSLLPVRMTWICSGQISHSIVGGISSSSLNTIWISCSCGRLFSHALLSAEEFASSSWVVVEPREQQL